MIDTAMQPEQLRNAWSDGWRKAGRIRPFAVFLSGAVAVITFVASDFPVLSWWVAWLGSLILLLASVAQSVFTVPSDRAWSDQTLRPCVLLHVVFVGYNCLTSLFFWADLNGFYYFSPENSSSSPDILFLAAQAQRMYLIGHIGLVFGLALGMRWRPPRSYQLAKIRSLSVALVYLAVAATVGIYIFRVIPGLSQFSEKMRTLATVAAAVSLGIAYRERISGGLVVPIILNIVLLFLALTSGWKSEVIVLVLLNASVFFPVRPYMTTFVTASILSVGLGLLPPLAGKVRNDVWQGQGNRFTALLSAIEVIQGRSWVEAKKETWEFLTQRLSEESLFIKYLRAVPDQHPHYGVQICQQALLTPIPRILWEGKPDTELLVATRVIELGVVSRTSNVSAKPQTIVDGYLSFGSLGVFFAMVFYGAIASALSRFCESLLGGYLMGGVLFNGLFGILWTGACFEFLVNAVFWSLVFTLMIHQLGRSQKLLFIPRGRS